MALLIRLAQLRPINHGPCYPSAEGPDYATLGDIDSGSLAEASRFGLGWASISRRPSSPKALCYTRLPRGGCQVLR